MYKNTPFKLQLDIEHDASMDSYPGALGRGQYQLCQQRHAAWL